MPTFNEQIQTTQDWFQTKRFEGITRLHTARQVVEQRGTIPTDYTVARDAAAGFHARLRELFNAKRSITTFGPYSPGQAVAMKRMGIEGIYLGGWATSAKGSITEDPGPDLASYPLSQVPDEAAPLVRALLAADRNQHYARTRMGNKQLAATPEHDFRPFIIADADTGHGGEAHVRNLVRRFAEVGVPGYHIEDQKPGVKKCGHQAGKVLVPVDEWCKRLNAARFQLDVMQVPGIVVARTDAEAATYLDGRGDERDHPFILGATGALPSYKNCAMAIFRRMHELGVEEVKGHLLYRISDEAYEAAGEWLNKAGLGKLIEEKSKAFLDSGSTHIDPVVDEITNQFVDDWQREAGLKTYGQAVADVMAFHEDEGEGFDLTIDEWLHFSKTVSFAEAKDKARSMGVNILWDSETPRTPEGYYQIKGGIEYAVARSLAATPFCDLLWMETKTADLKDAKIYQEAVHAIFPDQMLAYNLSPSFNWDTTGMSDEEMKKFPEELGKLGFVFNFITYGGHQIDGLAGEEFATALVEDGMLALARLQRKLRLVDSPYKTPQTLVGGPRIDGALMGSTGNTATTKAMGKGSTQFQHLVQTEVPPSLLQEWLDLWRDKNGVETQLAVQLRPNVAGSELLELSVLEEGGEKVANVIFTTMEDRRDRTIVSVRDENVFSEELRRKRLMTVMSLFLIHRYKAFSVHYVTPTEDNRHMAKAMQGLGIFEDVDLEVGDIIVARVSEGRVSSLLGADRVQLGQLIGKDVGVVEAG